MAINLESLSPAELQVLIKNAEAQMGAARKNHVQDVRIKIDALLKSSGLTLAEVYPTRGGKVTKAPRPAVAPKYRNPRDATQTWSGRGKRPIWFVEALKKRGVTAESLLIGSTQRSAPTKDGKNASATSSKAASTKKASK